MDDDREYEIEDFIRFFGGEKNGLEEYFKNFEGDYSTISLLLTMKCNFRCEHCFFSCGPDRSGSWMKLETIGKILERSEEAVLFPVNSINLIGGEPTLSLAKFEERFNYVDRYWDQEIQMTTNGWWLRDRRTQNRFLRIVERLAGDPEKFVVRISGDKFHKVFSDMNVKQELEEMFDRHYYYAPDSDYPWIYVDDNLDYHNVIPAGRGYNVGMDEVRHPWGGRTLKSQSCWCKDDFSFRPNGRFLELPWGNVFDNTIDELAIVLRVSRIINRNSGCGNCRETAQSLVTDGRFPELLEIIRFWIGAKAEEIKNNERELYYSEV